MCTCTEGFNSLVERVCEWELTAATDTEPATSEKNKKSRTKYLLSARCEEKS